MFSCADARNTRTRKEIYESSVDALFRATPEAVRAGRGCIEPFLDFAMFRVEQLVRFGRSLESFGAKLDPEPGSLAPKWVAYVESLLESVNSASAV